MYTGEVRMDKGFNTGTAKEFRTITDERIVIDHLPTRFVKVYVDPRQTAEKMNLEGQQIRDRILNMEKLIQDINDEVYEFYKLSENEDPDFKTKFDYDEVANLLRGLLSRNRL